MTISPDLQNAFRWHMRNNRPAFYHAQGYNGRNAWPEKANGIALEALLRARADLAAGTHRYPAPVKPYPAATWQPSKPGLAYVETPESNGLRFVGRVSPDFRRGPFTTRDSEGWLTDPHGNNFRDGTGLCWGEVWQMPGHNGESRFVAGYRFGGGSEGTTIDFGTIYTEPRGDYDASPTEHEAARDAARTADSMAQHAAEDEREYQTAWLAGSDYAQDGETIAEARKELLVILGERRRMKGQTGFPALCEAIRAQVESLLETIAEARNRRLVLAQGDADGLYFWHGDGRLRKAFCEAAGIETFPL